MKDLVFIPYLISRDFYVFEGEKLICLKDMAINYNRVRNCIAEIGTLYNILRASLVAQWWRIHLPTQESWVWCLSWEDPLEKKKWQPTPLLLPGKFHGQRSWVGYSPWVQGRGGHSLATEQYSRLKGEDQYLKINSCFSHPVQLCLEFCPNSIFRFLSFL